MPTTTGHSGRHHDGLRPFDPYRDTHQVLDLVEVAFGDALDPDERLALARMRRLARRRLLRLLFLLDGDARVAPGFVWVAGGRIVGNVSLRRSRAGWGGFFIGNVAVHPDWRGQGIARALVQAAIDLVVSLNGHWVGLEVRTDNLVARTLYEHFGFQAHGETAHLLRPPGPPPPPEGRLRRARPGDGPALFTLVQAVVPEPQRSLLELTRDEYRLDFERMLDLLLYGRREHWWIAEEGGQVRGAVRLLYNWYGDRPARLEVLVAPAQRGRWERALVRRGLGARPSVAQRRMLVTEVPAPSEPLLAALREVGFREQRRLVQMRLDLRT